MASGIPVYGPDLTTAEGQRIKALERENRELRQAHEIPARVKVVAASFMQRVA